MNYKSISECINDLDNNGHLLKIQEQVDPYLEMAAIHRQVHRENGPAILFENIKNSNFPAVSNLFGTMDRIEYIFQNSLNSLQLFLNVWGNPLPSVRQPLTWPKLLKTALYSFPQRIRSGLPENICINDVKAGMSSNRRKKIPVLECECCIEDLPQIHSWPFDGGSFITLPQVCSLPPIEKINILKSNVGMYRVQMSGNDYTPNLEVGLHYQIHRGIGIHHTQAIEAGKELKVSIFIGGPPAHTIAAMMPLPENMSEVTFAGMLAARRFRYTTIDNWIISTEADFCILVPYS